MGYCWFNIRLYLHIYLYILYNLGLKKIAKIIKIVVYVYGSLVTQSCPTLCNPMGSSLPGFSAHKISQARILEWVAIPFSRKYSQCRDRSQAFCIADRFFTVCHQGSPHGSQRSTLHCERDQEGFMEMEFELNFEGWIGGKMGKEGYQYYSLSCNRMPLEKETATHSSIIA